MWWIGTLSIYVRSGLHELLLFGDFAQKSWNTAPRKFRFYYIFDGTSLYVRYTNARKNYNSFQTYISVHNPFKVKWHLTLNDFVLMHEFNVRNHKLEHLWIFLSRMLIILQDKNNKMTLNIHLFGDFLSSKLKLPNISKMSNLLCISTM